MQVREPLLAVFAHQLLPLSLINFRRVALFKSIRISRRVHDRIDQCLFLFVDLLLFFSLLLEDTIHLLKQPFDIKSVRFAVCCQIGDVLSLPLEGLLQVLDVLFEVFHGLVHLILLLLILFGALLVLELDLCA